MHTTLTTHKVDISEAIVNENLSITASTKAEKPLNIVQILTPYCQKGFAVKHLNYEGMPVNQLKVTFKN